MLLSCLPTEKLSPHPKRAMKKILTFLSVLVACAILSGAQLQADVITNWDFNVNSYFISWVGPENDAKGKVGTQVADGHGNRTGNTSGISFYNDRTIMEWSSYDSKKLRSSSLELNGLTGTIRTDGVSETALTMTHNNATVGTIAPTPKFMDIAVNVLLSGTHADGTEITKNVELVMQLGFMETPNKNVGMLPGHTEDDIFFVVNSPTTTERFTDALGNVYDVSMDAVFQEITGIHLDTAAYYIDERLGDYYEYDSTQPLYGWSTLEGESTANAMDVNIVVRHIPPSSTPEPATWLLMTCAGAVGLPLYRRCRKIRKENDA